MNKLFSEKAVQPMIKTNPITIGIYAAFTLMFSPHSLAEENTLEQNDLALERITVVSQKRTQSLQEVPIAISAFGEDVIEKAGILDIQDVSAMTPGFALSSYNSVTPQPFIRGVGTNSSSVGDDSSVGIFIDEVYAGRAGGFSADMFDIARIEVLRGPQGSLYGRNVAGGAINIITNEPTDSFEGKLKLSTGAYNLVELQGMINGALSDKVNGRLVLSKRERDGWQTNVSTGNELRDQDNMSMRGKLAFELNQQSRLMLSVDYAKDDLIGSGARNVIGIGHPTEQDTKKVALFTDGFSHRKMHGISANYNMAFEGMDFTSITAYRHQEYRFMDDLIGEYLAFAPAALTNDATEESSQFTQELRLQSNNEDALQWTVGLYYFTEDVERVESFDSTKVYDLVGAGGLGLSSRPLWDAENKTTSYAVFGELNYTFNDAWSIALGGRYTRDTKDFANIATGAGDLFGFLQENYQVNKKQHWSKFTPKLTVNYTTPSADLIYLTMSKGFKAGGYNGLATTYNEAIVAFNPENATNYELGFKTTWLEERMRVNGAFYFLDYTDLQSFTTNVDTGEVKTATGDAEIYGVEIEAIANITENLSTSLSYALAKSKYTSFASDANVVGNELARTPENTFTFAVNYELNVSEDSFITFRADAMYQDDIYFSILNEAAASDKARTLVNFSATWENNNGYKVSLWGKNLTDKEYNVHAFALSGVGFAIAGEPRTWGISFTKDFW